MESIMQFIQTVGFPIFIAVYLLYNQSEMSKEHKAEVDKMSEAINNNTDMLKLVLEHMREEDKGS